MSLVSSMLPVFWCLLSVVCFLSSGVSPLKLAICCQASIVCGMLSVVWCLLSSVCFLYSGFSCLKFAYMWPHNCFISGVPSLCQGSQSCSRWGVTALLFVRSPSNALCQELQLCLMSWVPALLHVISPGSALGQEFQFFFMSGIPVLLKVRCHSSTL